MWLIHINPERDIAYLPLETHGPLRQVWRALPFDFAIDLDAQGDLVGVEVLRQSLQEHGVRPGWRNG